MSYLGPSTKRVSVYGKKRGATRVVATTSTFLISPVKNSTNSALILRSEPEEQDGFIEISDSDSESHLPAKDASSRWSKSKPKPSTKAKAKPTSASRPPLSTKSNIVQPPPTTESGTRTMNKDESRKPHPSSSSASSSSRANSRVRVRSSKLDSNNKENLPAVNPSKPKSMVPATKSRPSRNPLGSRRSFSSGSSASATSSSSSTAESDLSVCILIPPRGIESRFQSSSPSRSSPKRPSSPQSSAASNSLRIERRPTRQRRPLRILISDSESEDEGRSDEDYSEYQESEDGSDQSFVSGIDDRKVDEEEHLIDRLKGLKVDHEKIHDKGPITGSKDESLKSLLRHLSQEEALDFDAAIRDLKAKANQPSRPKWNKGGLSRISSKLEKIGEASYSEVFKLHYFDENSGGGRNGAGPKAPSRDQILETSVIKIIPIRLCDDEPHPEEVDVPDESSCDDVCREVEVTKRLGTKMVSESSTFVELKHAQVVKGAYPEELLQAWDRFDQRRRKKYGEGAENIRPSVLPPSQHYAVLVLSDGGPDLESAKLKDWSQAAGLFWQVTRGIAGMEEAFGFEHRDLHWGNILVQTSTPKLVVNSPKTPPDCDSDSSCRQKSKARSRRNTPEEDSQGGAGQVPQDMETYSEAVQSSWTEWLLEPQICGSRATIIDFSLSRISGGKNSEVIAYNFEAEEIFEGEGDFQFDVYRSMRDLTKGDWDSFFPLTNLMWLQYLIRKLLQEKGLKPPPDLTTYLARKDTKTIASIRSTIVDLSSNPEDASKGQNAAKMKEMQKLSYLSLLLADEILSESLKGGVKSRQKGRTTKATTSSNASLPSEKAHQMKSASELFRLFQNLVHH
ncbi:hypothetical protein IE53DRAFT_378522 [Violaceomyces palustris]|uniref:Uncharacterized protein n=1 Tax=Violaceomyces palustris TaxID=1673888 RepID=A0ACD0P1R0_9BASI|nr:hypothetical protein IE53DRAFT_378522 [Violaceomyces palustris]